MATFIALFSGSVSSLVKTNGSVVKVYWCQHRPSSVENLMTVGVSVSEGTATSRPPWSAIW